MFLFGNCQWMHYSQTPFETYHREEENKHCNRKNHNFLFINVDKKFGTPTHLVEVIQPLY